MVTDSRSAAPPTSAAINASNRTATRLAEVPEIGSERESETPPDFMRVLDFGNCGYTQEDARNRLEQSTRVAWI